MSEEEKEAIELLESFEPDDLIECAIYRRAIDTVLNLIDKQNKVIDYILNDYVSIHEIRTIMGLSHSINTVEELKEVYFRKMEEDDNRTSE